MFALLSFSRYPVFRRITLALSLLLISINGSSQPLDSLKSHLASCQTMACLDTIYSIDLQFYLNDTRNGKELLKIALHKAELLEYEAIRPKINTELARLFYYQSEYDSSFFYRISAIKQLEKLEEWALAGREYTEIGYQYKRMNLPKGFDYMSKGIALLRNTEDSLGLANAYNNYGVLHEMNNNLDSALHYYAASLVYKMSMNDSIGIPYSLENIANIQITQKQFDEAELNLNTALDYRLAVNDQQGLLGNLINLGELNFHKKKYIESISFFEKALVKEKQIGHPYAAQYCYEKISDVYRQMGQFENALNSHIKFSTIKDSISNLQNVKNVEALTIQYETEKKEKEIVLLSVANKLKESEIKMANNRLFATMVAAGLLLLTIYLLFNRYKHKQRALLAEEKAINQKQGFKSLIEGEEKERKRIAQELHDGLGQLLSTARLNVSAMEDRVEKVVTKQWENSLKLIDDAVTEVRHISHNMMPNALISIGFEAAIKEQVHIINDAGLVKIHSDMPNEKINLEESEAIALYRVIQEILNNALKYAEAKNIWLSISFDERLQISIKDDGKGFDTNLISNSQGIGWQNIHSRMEILNGEILVTSNIGEGSEVSLKIVV